MIHVNTINTTIEAKDSQPHSKELKGLSDSITAMSQTPEWQAYLLGLQENETKCLNSKKTKKSQIGTIPKTGKQGRGMSKNS